MGTRLKRFYIWLSKPTVIKAFHGWCTVFWLPFTAFALYIGWLESLVFISVVSMVALWLGSFSSWQAARAEVFERERDEQ